MVLDKFLCVYVLGHAVVTVDIGHAVVVAVEAINVIDEKDGAINIIKLSIHAISLMHIYIFTLIHIILCCNKRGEGIYNSLLPI